MLTPHQIQASPKEGLPQLARRAQLLPTLCAMHPRLAATEPHLLVETNRVHAQGLLRNWAILLEQLLDMRPGDRPFTRSELIDAITVIDNAVPAFAA